MICGRMPVLDCDCDRVQGEDVEKMLVGLACFGGWILDLQVQGPHSQSQPSILNTLG